MKTGRPESRPASCSRFLVREVGRRGAKRTRPVGVERLADEPRLPRNRCDFVEGIARAGRAARMGDDLPAAGLVAGIVDAVRVLLAEAHGAEGVLTEDDG